MDSKCKLIEKKRLGDIVKESTASFNEIISSGLQMLGSGCPIPPENFTAPISSVGSIPQVLLSKTEATANDPKTSSYTFVKSGAARPAIIQRADRNLDRIDVATWEGWYLPRRDPRTGELLPSRERGMKVEVGDKMKVVAKCIVHHVHVSTGEVWSTVSQMAVMCGMTTTSAAGNVSISKMANAVRALEEVGAVKCHQCVWHPVLRIMIPKFITVTNLFWDLVGITKEELQSAVKQQLAYLRSLGKKISSYREFVLNKIMGKRTAQEELGISSRKLQKSHSELRQEILRRVIQTTDRDKLNDLGPSGLRKLINFYLAKFNIKAPTPQRS